VASGRGGKGRCGKESGTEKLRARTHHMGPRLAVMLLSELGLVTVAIARLQVRRERTLDCLSSHCCEV
jgi:hypothetical protein